MTKNQEYLQRTIWLGENYGLNDFIDYYKNYSIVINDYFRFSDFMRIVIYKLEKNNRIVKVYENNNKEEILKIFGKNLQKNSYSTVHKKIVNFIKAYDL